MWVRSLSLACALHICIHLPGRRATQPLNNKTPAPLPALRRGRKLHTQIITPQSLRFFLPPLRERAGERGLSFFLCLLLSAGANFNFYRTLMNYMRARSAVVIFSTAKLVQDKNTRRWVECFKIVSVLCISCLEKGNMLQAVEKRKMLIPAGKNAK